MMGWLPDTDPGLVALSVGWIVLVVAVAEVLRRSLSLPSDVSRKIVHISVAAWALPTALLFDSMWWAALPPLASVPLNYLSYRYRLVATFEEEGKGSLGTVYFPLSFGLLILAFWPAEGGRAVSVAGMYAMGFGDASASILGRRIGRRKYDIGGGTKSVEGSLIMAAVSFLAIALGTWPLLGSPAWIPSLAAGAAAAVLEAPAGRGLDNLSVPLGAGGVFLLLLRLT